MEDVIVKDCNRNVLSHGDSIILTKTLDVKGSNISLKKGETIKNISLTDDTETVECKVGKARIVLKTCFIKKK